MRSKLHPRHREPACQWIVEPECLDWKGTGAADIRRSLWSDEGGRLRGTSVALSGVRGVGKTQLAACFIARICHGYEIDRLDTPCRYTSASDLYAELKAGFDEKRRGYDLAAFVDPFLLVIDNLEERRESGWEQETLMRILGPSIVDRCREGGGFFELNGERRRGVA